MFWANSPWISSFSYSLCINDMPQTIYFMQCKGAFASLCCLRSRNTNWRWEWCSSFTFAKDQNIIKKLVHICIDKREKLFMTDRKVNPARSSIVHFTSLWFNIGSELNGKCCRVNYRSHVWFPHECNRISRSRCTRTTLPWSIETPQVQRSLLDEDYTCT